MPELPVEPQKPNDNTITVITPPAVDDSRYFKIHKLTFWLVMILFVIGICITFFFMTRANNRLDERIKNDDLIISQMADSVKLRDAHIIALGESRKLQEEIIQVSKDSIARAYDIINKIKITKNGGYKKHISDSLAIEHSSIRGKVEFITGKH